MSEHVEIKHRIQQLKRSEFETILEESMLTVSEKEVMRDIYLNHVFMDYIADRCGYHVNTIRKIHLKCLDKLKNAVLSLDKTGIS